MATNGVNWNEVIEEVKEALEWFEQNRIKPTLRTLYYRLVSKNIIPNTKNSYKTLSRKLVEARKKGIIPFDAFVDKTRYSKKPFGLGWKPFTVKDVETKERRLEEKFEELDLTKLIENEFGYYKEHRGFWKWCGQPYYVEVWMEKDALADTVWNWIKGEGVVLRVNRGYGSWSFLHESINEMMANMEDGMKPVVLYFGDLDPTGVDIDRFLQEVYEYFGVEVEFKRIAVTPEQIEKYNLPPRPEDAETIAKLQRDVRSKNYKEKYIVELDSLLAFVPDEFKKILRTEINNYWDKVRFDEIREEHEKIKDEINRKVDEYIEKAKKTYLKNGGEA